MCLNFTGVNNSFIYLLDERIQRQERLAPYLIQLSQIKVIQSPENFEIVTLEVILSNCSMICLHDSFFSRLGANSSKHKNALKIYCSKNKLSLVIFGGGISAVRKMSDYNWLIPVKRFYDNLRLFYDNSFLIENYDLATLAFGKNKIIEQTLSMRARLTYRIHSLKLDEVVKFSPSDLLDVSTYSNLVSDNYLIESIKNKVDITRSRYLEWLNITTSKILYETSNN